MAGENVNVDVLVDDTDIVDTVETTVESTVETATGKPERNRKRLVAIIAAIVVVVLVAAGVGGWLAWSRHELDAAKASCSAASDSLRVKANEYDGLVNGDAQTASAITAERVKDGKTVEALAAAVKEEAPAYTGCVADSKAGLDAATAKLNTQAEWYTTHTASLSKAVEQVNSSKLDKIIDTANALLADSDGKVADNATRDELSKAIEAKDEKAISDATVKVNESIAAKTKADEEAAAKAKAEEEAAAAQAAAAAAQQSYNSYNYSSSSSSSSGSSSTGSSSSKPVLSSGHGVGLASECGEACRVPIDR